jgi:hypothetical protein
MCFKVTGCVFWVQGFEKTNNKYYLGFEPNHILRCVGRSGSVFTLVV